MRPFGPTDQVRGLKAHDRLEAAAARAIGIGTLTCGSVRSILDNKLERQAAPPRPADAAPLLHPDIRGPRYCH